MELSAAELAERLTAAGLPVDSVEPHGRFDRVLAGRIVGLERHPGSDRLKLCRVDLGDGAPLRIVSGAPNLDAGLLVAVALPGARLADGSVVEPIEIRGVGSEGVTVSEKEIGVSEDASGVMVLGPEATPGKPLADILGTGDTILEIDVTPNRGDCLSILGIAREVAALTGERLRIRAPKLAEKQPPASERVGVEIRDPDLCQRYVARVVRNVTDARSPLWMRARLEALGVRSLNAVVDVTNYVMLERGQPLHAFDLDRVREGRIVVRRAGATTTFVTLDDVERRLEPDDLVIADAEGPVALAGVMGGAESAVGPATRDVLLEAARFAPEAIRRTSRRLGLRSESSLRFERGVDVEGVLGAASRAVELFAKVAGGEAAAGAVDRYPEPRALPSVLVRSERVNRLLGTTFPVSEIGQSLRRVSESVKAAGRGFLCRPPSFRADLTREADFIEEVARLAGYDRIPATLPSGAIAAGRMPEGRSIDDEIRSALTAQGMTEMVLPRFVATRWNRRFVGLVPSTAGTVEVVNPISAEASEMQKSLLPGLLLAARRNVHQGEGWVRAFEIGTVFWREPGGAFAESTAIGGVLLGRIPPLGVGLPARAESFADVKGAVESVLARLGISAVRWSRTEAPSFLHPGKSAIVSRGGDAFGYVGGLHPEVAREIDLEGEPWVFELDRKKLGSYASRRITFQPLPRFPAIVRDVAIVTDESFEAQAVIDSISRRTDLRVEHVRLFDVYRGAPLPPGKKSLAYSIAYRSPDRTMTDEEVNEVHRKLVDGLREELGIELRS